MTITFVREFVGYYTVRGPKGYVEAPSREKAIELARLVAEPWEDIKVEAPYQRLFDISGTYYVRLGPN
jgi:hypothetical protein